VNSVHWIDYSVLSIRVFVSVLKGAY